MRGWVAIWRQLFREDHWLNPSKRHPESKRGAWVDLIQLAQHSTYEHVVTLQRGEVLVSVRWLAKRWHWSVPATARYMQRLRTDTMIETVRETPQGTVFRLCNYPKYADPLGEWNTDRDGQRDTSETPPRHLRDTSDTRTTMDPEPWTLEPSTTAAEPREWSKATLQKVAAMFGLGREGTDEKVWQDAGLPADHELREPKSGPGQLERKRLARLAADRLQDEGRRYHVRQYRNTLLQVIREQHGTGGSAGGSPKRGRGRSAADAVDGLFGKETSP